MQARSELLRLHSQRLETIDAGRPLTDLTPEDIDFSARDEELEWTFHAPTGAAHTAVHTLLARAAHHGNAVLVEQLLSLGATVDRCFGLYSQSNALKVACIGGHVDVIKTLLAAGADPNRSFRVFKNKSEGNTFLEASVLSGNEGAVLCLLEAGATCSLPSIMQLLVEQDMPGALWKIADAHCQSDPLFVEDCVTMEHFLAAVRVTCKFGRVECLRILRGCMGQIPWEKHCRLRRQACTFRQLAIVEELDKSARWNSPLHCLERMPAARARALLRYGAHFNQRQLRGPSPLDLAMEHISSPASAVVLLAAGPWSPEMHALLPSPNRRRVVDMLIVGYQIARLFGLRVGSFVDAWVGFVLPHAGRRASNPAGRWS
jgi:ankyrin repeat protein